MNFPMIVLLCFVCCLFSCRVTKDRRTLTGIVVMGRTYKRRSKSLEATALEIIVTDTGNTALKLEVPGCKDYVALRLNRHEVKKFKEALIACGNEPMVVTLFQYKVNGKHCYILYHEPGKEDSYPKFDGAKEDELKTKCRTARNIAFVLYGFSLILYPLAWWVSVILIVAASVLIYLNIPLLDDELWFDSCEFIKRPKQVKGKNSDSDIVASQASIILEEISEKYQDKGKSDKDYEQHQETSAKPTEKEPTKDSKKPETSAPINNNEPVNVKVNIHPKSIRSLPKSLTFWKMNLNLSFLPPLNLHRHQKVQMPRSPLTLRISLSQSWSLNRSPKKSRSLICLWMMTIRGTPSLKKTLIPPLVFRLTPVGLTWTMIKRTRLRRMTVTCSILLMM